MDYLDKHIEELYRPYEDTPAELLQAKHSKKDKRYRMRTIKSGTMLESDSYLTWNAQRKNKARNIIKEYDAEKRRAYYEKNIRKNVVRLLQGNFTSKDMWIHLTYRDGVEPQSDEEAKKDIVNYLRRLKRLMEKYEWGSFKYVYVIDGSTNKNGTRYHHHVVTNFPDLDLAKAKWNKGKYPQTDRLTPDDDIGLEKMAKYLTKEVKDEDKPDELAKNKKSYGYSMNLYKSWQHATIADCRMTRSRAEKLATGRIDAKAFYENLYKGWTFQKMEVRTSDYVSGYYISVTMCKKIE